MRGDLPSSWLSSFVAFVTSRLSSFARRVTFNDQVASAEVPADLTQHTRHRVRGEARAVLGVESLECFDQAEPRDLHQIVKRLAPVHEPSSDVAGDPQVVVDQLVAQARVSGGAVPRESLVGHPFLCQRSPQLAVLVNAAVSTPAVAATVYQSVTTPRICSESMKRSGLLPRSAAARVSVSTRTS